MSMNTHTRTRAQTRSDEDAFRASVLVHVESLMPRIMELVAQLVVVLCLGLGICWIMSVYVRVILVITAAMWAVEARVVSTQPRELFLVA